MSGRALCEIVEHRLERARRGDPDTFAFVVRSRVLASEIADWLTDTATPFHEEWLSAPPHVFTFFVIEDLTEATYFKLKWSAAIAADLKGLFDG